MTTESSTIAPAVLSPGRSAARPRIAVGAWILQAMPRSVTGAALGGCAMRPCGACGAR